MRKFVAIILVAFLITFFAGCGGAKNSGADQLTDTQKNSIAMLNYLASLSYEINASKNSRLFLEEAYSALINNTDPERVNELAQSHLSSMLDIIEKYRMISVKRERLQYIYDQNKAKALRNAIPNPLGLLSSTNTQNVKMLAVTAVYMAVDSVSSYQAYQEDIKHEFLQSGWELDDEEASNLHDSRTRAFSFMVDMVREEKIPGRLTLNEDAVKEFIEWKNDDNIFQKIQFFEASEATYSSFGSYWLELASCYYENKDYQKCLDAVKKYEELDIGIFRKDYDYAMILPKVIVAADVVYSGKEYASFAENCIEKLLANTENSDWALRYFAAEMYVDLFGQTKNKEYLVKAYEITLNNVNVLVKEQRTMNETYLNDVKEVVAPGDSTDSQKKEIKEYNKALLEQRKSELPPVSEPLVLNCELLFDLAEERGISEQEKQKIENILRSNDGPLFLNDALEQKFSFTFESTSTDAQFGKETLSIPVSSAKTDATIKVTVTTDGVETVFEDWTIKEVKRPSKDIDTFTAVYKSKKIADYKWSKNSTIKVEIITAVSSEPTVEELNFIVSKYKDWWILADEIEFAQVK